MLEKYGLDSIEVAKNRMERRVSRIRQKFLKWE